MATDLGKPSAGPQERVPRPRGAHAAVKGRPAAAPTSPAVRVPRCAVPRTSAAGLCAAALVAVVVPLAVLQIPDAIAWSLPSQFAVAGPNALASLLRAASLALPTMAVAAPLGALATRRFRAAPVLLAGPRP